jgi:hypothetical protein
LVQGAWNRAAALDSPEFLPCKRTSSTSLISVAGTGYEFRFYSPGRDNEFFRDFRKGAPVVP